jgi:Putative Ig domain
MISRGILGFVTIFCCSAVRAQTAPTLVVTGSGSTSSQFSGDYYGSYDSNPFTLSAAQPSVTPADNFNITGSFASSSATIHVHGNVVFGRTVFNFCPYSFCTWVYRAGATLNISLQGTPGTNYAIDITRTATMSTATADPDGAYTASADSTSVNTQSGPSSANFSTVNTVQGTGSISTSVSLGAGVGFRQTSCVSDAEGCLGGTTYPGGGAGTVDYTLSIVARVNNQSPLTLSCPANSAMVNTPYASAFAASGGTGTFTSYSIATGVLPPVLSLNSFGGVTGTPTTAGPFSFTGSVTDSSGTTATSPPCSITVAPAQPPPLTLSCPTTSGTVNAPYASAFAAFGGTGTFTSYSIATGSLPSGLSLNSTGGVTGTPTTGGAFPFTGSVTDSSGATARSPACNITIAPQALGAIQVTANLPAATFTISGPASYSGGGVSFTQTNAPAGSYNATFGPVTGYSTPPSQTRTLAAGGNVSFTGIYISLSQLSIACPSRSGTLNVAYASGLNASGGTPPYQFSIISGSIPPNLTFDATSGSITGTPTTTGTFSFTASVQDLAGGITDGNCSISVRSTISDIQLVCRPLDDTPGDPTHARARLGRHCYFLIDESGNTKHTVGAYDINGLLTPADDGDLDQNGAPKLGTGCGISTLAAECTPIPLVGSQTYDNIADQLETAVGQGPQGAYDKISNNSNLWAQERIQSLGSLVFIPVDVITDKADFCRLLPSIEQNLANAGVSVPQRLIVYFYGVITCP